MGRNKYSAGEIKEIGKLLRLKNAGNRLQQKMIRHDLRVDYEFNISDFNEPGKAFGEEELQDAIKRGGFLSQPCSLSLRQLLPQRPSNTPSTTCPTCASATCASMLLTLQPFSLLQHATLSTPYSDAWRRARALRLPW